MVAISNSTSAAPCCGVAITGATFGPASSALRIWSSHSPEVCSPVALS